MKNYIKPTFVIAGLSPMGLGTPACSISESQKEEIADSFGADWDKLFYDFDTDGCEEATYLEGFYCKLSYAAEDNPDAIKIFSSF